MNGQQIDFLNIAAHFLPGQRRNTSDWDEGLEPMKLVSVTDD
jgi:hypothetical protein